MWGVGPDSYLCERQERGCRRYRTPKGYTHLLSHNLFSGWQCTYLIRKAICIFISVYLGACLLGFSKAGWGEGKASYISWNVKFIHNLVLVATWYNAEMWFISLWVTDGFLALFYCTGTEHVISPWRFLVAFLQIHLNLCNITLKWIFSSGYVSFLDSYKLA